MATFATFDSGNKAASVTLSNGNLTATFTSNASFKVVMGNIGKSSGKWYWEYHLDVQDGAGNNIFGIGGVATNLNSYVGKDADGYGNYPNTGSGANKVNNNSFSAYGNSAAQGDTIGVAMDMDGGTITIYINGSSQGTMFSSLSGTLYPGVSSNVINNAITANFGASAFAQSVPSGFNAGLYTGSITSIKTINGLAQASVKTKNGLAIASIKNFNGLA